MHRIFNQSRRIFCRVRGTHGQIPDFIGHHGESGTGFSGPRRFHSRIESEQVGLKGDFVDGFDNFCVSSLALEISAMEVLKAPIERLAFTVMSLVSLTSALAWLACSAFCLVIDAICSREALVSSRDAACSEEP